MCNRTLSAFFVSLYNIVVVVALFIAVRSALLAWLVVSNLMETPVEYTTQ